MASADDIRTAPIASFGPFRLSPTERRLERDDEAVAIGSRSLDILIALVERAGEILSRRELMGRVWPDVVVEDANLRVHIAGLRRALGDARDGARYVANVPGRGYCFVAPVQWGGATPHAQATDTFEPRRQRMPPRPARMVGRADTVVELSALLRSHRFVSVVGAGGMGKTTVAVAVAHALVDDFENAVFFVDLGGLTDAALLPFSIASALGLHAPAQVPDPLADLVAFLGGRRLLLLLDCCEHLIAAAAAAAERFFSEAPQVHLLVTSREALRVDGEHVHLLRPLETPPFGVEMTAAEALTSPAVQLFMERAVASGHRLPLSDGDANVVADMCRRLDGIALAIELAASRVGTYGIRGTADLLDGGLKLSWQGRRSAMPRHQTLQAMLDWSYHLLSERDRRILCRLSVFVSVFTLEGVHAVAADAAMDGVEVADALANLVDKSLVWASAGEPALFRLLDTTRAYAAAKLTSSGEADQVARRHASYYAEKLKAEAIEVAIVRGRNFSVHAPHVDNVRAAVAWSFSLHGNRAMAVQLAARSAPLFIGQGLLGECGQWCERGLAAMDDGERGSETELVLREALAISAMYTQGNSGAVRPAIERGLELADALGKWQHKLHLLGWLAYFLQRCGDFRGALEGAEQSLVVAQATGNDHGIAMANWLLGGTNHFVGDQEKAQRHLELGFERAPVAAPVEMSFFGERRVRALSGLVRTLWLRGYPDRAARLARQAIDEAEQLGHPVTVGICLAFACTTVSLWRGDLAQAAEHVARLMAHASRHSLRAYEALGIGLKAELEIARGAPGAGVDLLRIALGTLRAERYHFLWTTFSRALAEGLAQTGDTDEALATIDAALAWAEQTGGTYDVPDLLRVKGQILLSSSNGSAEPAEQVLLQSLTLAREQSALAWELRSAITLARLRAGKGRADAARNILLDAYQRFTEGFTTADLKTAAQLLEPFEPAA